MDSYIDAISDRGLLGIGLPSTYPLDGNGEPISHALCQPIGQRAWTAGEPGIVCRSAAPSAPNRSEELAFFARRRLRVDTVEDYVDWYW
jgi:hypothetical protein